ncbi:MAG: glycoside hydrolase family 25 protein [Oscillospiraceae bacterium]|nr:glycoside hydrolase family 25 protein [Oscillospiraceae bacterium]
MAFKIKEWLKKPKNIFLIVQTAAIIALGIILGVVMSRLNSLEERAVAVSAQLHAMEDSVISPENAVSFNDGAMGDVWLSRLTDVPENPYKSELFKLENGIMSYNDEELGISSRAGIDVSYFQGYIDWEKVKASGIEFVMLRIGYRGYESGKLNMDERFAEYIEGAEDAGLHVGVYFFSQAVHPEEALEEAKFVAEILDGYKIAYPVVYDWEMIGTSEARTDEVSPEVLNQCCVAFCDYIRQSGYTAMIYANRRTALMKMNMSRLKEYDFWLAEYRDEPSYPYIFTMWQYASDGKIDGIETEVDMNISFIDYAKSGM